jgi:hypothetical protein
MSLLSGARGLRAENGLGTVDPLFLDDFGAAATCRWSAAVP